MARRKLSAEERALWEKVVKDAAPLPRSSGVSPDAAAPVPKPKSAIKNSVTIPDGFAIGSRANPPPLRIDRNPDIQDRLAAGPVQMDAKAFRNMTRGNLAPEARLDLHGMTLDAAHTALVRFVLGAASRGLRLVLVITGKGKDRPDPDPIPVRRGLLRNQVPAWLRQAPLNSFVLQVSPAHRRHGGSGAYYVYLRRRR